MTEMRHRVRRNRRRIRHWAVLSVMAVGLVFVMPAAASFVGVKVTGSDFEIDSNANLVVDAQSPSIDWASVDEERQNDLPTGSGDNSFVQGTKEDTAIPVTEFGSIPPNKSDLKTFGVYVEQNAAGKFVHLFWTRVQDPSGTTNMDFEFNREKCEYVVPPTSPPTQVPGSSCSANGVTPVRTAGDLLVVYELGRGGTVPELSKLEWLGSAADGTCEASNAYPCWGNRTDLDAAGAAVGSINSSAISAASSEGLGDLSARTFGEASIDLASVFDPNACESFGSAYLKSRSSDSFTAAMKDFIAPLPTTISNCATVTIRKQTVPAGVTETFDFAHTVATDPANGSSFSLADDGVQSMTNVLAGGPYTVTEDIDDVDGALSKGFVLTDIDCSESSGVEPTIDEATGQISFSITVGDTVDCTYTNSRLPQLKVVKSAPFGSDAGDAFDLQIDGVTEKEDAVDGGNTGFVTVSAGSHAVGEIAGNADTDLGQYDSYVACDNGAGDATTLQTSLSGIELAYGDEVTCTVTNKRLPELRVVKDLIPDTDDGRFDLIIDGNASLPGGIAVGDQSDPLVPGDTGFVTVEFGSHTVSENAGDLLTDLADYVSSISCDNGTAGEGTSLGVTLGYGDEVTCTITNERRVFTIVAYVCETTGTLPVLYKSTVTLGTAKTTQDTVPSGTTAETLCGLAANFGGTVTGEYTPTISIGTSPAP